MDQAFQLVVGLLLVFLAIVLAAIGAPGAVIAVIGVIACLLLLAGRYVWTARRRRTATTMNVGIAGATTPSGQPLSAGPASPKRDHLLHQGDEAPQKRAERQAIQREARQVSSTYRAMEQFNGMAATPSETRLAWLDRVTALKGRSDDYAERWSVMLPDGGNYSPLVPPVQPDWLEAMARDADVVAWQLDHEDGGPIREHNLAAVGGTRSTCTCGRTFDTGQSFDAHLRTRV
jgi:hypothetical protein